MFDIEKLIEEVAVKPAIWDYNCPQYQIRKERMSAWDEICYVLFDDFENHDVEKKSELCRLLQRKWKSLRDCYVRELNQNRHKNNRPYRRKYVFFNALSFLGNTFKNQQGSRVKAVDPLSDDTMESEQNMSFKRESSRGKTETTQREANNSNKRLRSADIQKKNTNQPSQQSTFEEDDEDRLFLMSLLKDLKKVPEDNKLEAKSELLLVLNKWKRSNVEAWDMEQILND